MPIPYLSTLLVAAALIGASPPPALAAPAPVAHAMLEPAKAPTATSDASQYAAREAGDTSAAKFRGGSETLTIGGSTVALVLLVVVIVLLL